jgi:hypothetical protein
VEYPRELFAGADRSSFELTANDAYGKDSRHVFSNSFGIIAGADPETFVSFIAPQSCGDGCIYDAQDNSGMYFDGKRLINLQLRLFPVAPN